ncbi:MAG: polysaccharide biosynthesis/export family protein [Bryobacteraceae bacterium]
MMRSCGFVLAAALAFGQQPQGEQKGADPKQTQEAKPGEPALPAPVDPKTYKIGAEDVIRVSVWREPELSFTAGVRPDGMITAPLIGEVQVSGLTPLELGGKLKEEFSKLVNNPVVSVDVQQVRSRKYYITGQVGKPGQFPLVVPLTVLEALTLAGGPTEFANKKKITIMRGTQRFYFNWNEMLKGKNPQQNIYVENGDFIVVK